MDLGPCVEENDAPFLIDSGTESITESPLEHSEESTVCDIDIKINTTRTKAKIKLATSLIDKSFSIDEDELCTPLEPTQVGFFLLTPSLESTTSEETTSEEDDGIEVNLSDIDKSKHEEVLDKLQHVEILEEKAETKKELEIIFEISPSDEDSNISDEQINHPATPRTSILRKSSCADETIVEIHSSPARRVFFPEDINGLVTYKEPENCYPWIINEFMTSEEILEIYQQSCKKHNTLELDALKLQILEIKNNLNHSANLKLCSIKITREVNETLEDILKVTNFHTMTLQECHFSPETMTEFLNILEYYKSVCNFEVAMNFEDDDTWKCFCNACSNIMVLESLSFKGMVISEHYMRLLISAIKNNANITSLKFDGCMLVKLPTFYLIDSLMSNRTIRELYLPSTGLYTKEADSLQRFLVNNHHLKVLDISNNNLGDRGLEVLAKGLCHQNAAGMGLSVLVIFNNQITEKSGSVIKNIIVECKNLHTLNIGYNNLTDDVLCRISEGLPSTESLEGLGLQNTLLTCKGILALAQAIPSNASLQKINLKGNKAIQILGVETLCNALTNSKISKIEIDETNRSCNDPEAYLQLVKKLNAICTVNKNYADDSSDDDEAEEEVLKISQKISRKVSLSCEPKYGVPDPARFQIGSPLPSPATSPAPRSRFQIVKVPESCKPELPKPISAPKSRFRVTRVPPSPDDDLDLGRFANIRSSVSSNDSVDSLTAIHLESDSE